MPASFTPPLLPPLLLLLLLLLEEEEDEEEDDPLVLPLLLLLAPLEDVVSSPLDPTLVPLGSVGLVDVDGSGPPKSPVSLAPPHATASSMGIVKAESARRRVFGMVADEE